MPNRTNNEKNRRIGGRLKYYRQKHNITQDEMAEFVGMSKSQISAIERGQSKASVEILLGYCKKLNLTPDDILGFSNGLYKELIVRLKTVATNRQMALLRMINDLEL